MKAIAVLPLVVLALASLPPAEASIRCTGADAAKLCRGEYHWEDPYCETGDYGTAYTRVGLEGEIAELEARGTRQCRIYGPGQEFERDRVGVDGRVGDVEAGAYWEQYRFDWGASKYQHCRQVVYAGSFRHTENCEEPPPNPGWGEVFPMELP